MAPPRSAYPSSLTHLPPNNHIIAKEKDILHKTIDSRISKPRKHLLPPNGKSALSSLVLDRRSASIPPISSATSKQFIWLDGPGSSEARMQWSGMTNEEINTWRNTLALDISAPFSSIQAQLSLENPDGLGQGTASMSGSHANVGLVGKSIRKPIPRVRLDQEIALAWESRTLDEDEVLAAFVARCNEDRELVVARNSGKIVSENAGVFDRRLERDDVNRFGGGGSVNGTGGPRNRPVRCRSDLLAE